MGFFDFMKMMTVNEGINRSRTEKNAFLVDVRAKEKYKKGHVAGSINVPVGRMSQLENRVRDKSAALYVIGDADASPRAAVRAMKKMGYKNAVPSGVMEDHVGPLSK